MITVRLLGGARKALGADTVEIESDSATVGDILGMIESRTSGAFGASNVLVAVNGADSSAAGGAGAKVRAGDDVAVIPVVHGGGSVGGGGGGRGGPQARALVSMSLAAGAAGRLSAKASSGGSAQAARRRGSRTVEAYVVRSGGSRRGSAVGGRGGGILPSLDDLRAEFPSVAIQAVSGRFVLGAGHLRRVVAVSAEAERRHTMVARRIETDILARLAGTSQISEAIKAAGRSGTSAGTYVVIAVGPAGRLGPLRARLGPLAAPSSPPLPASNARFLARRFGITAARMSAVAGAGRRPLEDLLVERAAVVGI